MRKILCLVAGIISVTYFSKGRTQQDVDTDIMTLDQKIAKLQYDLANHLKIKNYQAADTTKFGSFLDALKIKLQQTKQGNFQDRILCTSCQVLIRNLQTNAVPLQIVLTILCNIYFTLNSWTISDFCVQVVKINKPILQYIVQNSNILSPEYACTVLLQNEGCFDDNPALAWRISIPQGPAKIPEVSQEPFITPIKILHLTDFHISPDYEIGGVADCGYPVCCKKGLGNPLKGRNAGAWGDYNCDLSPRLFEETLLHISNNHQDISAIYFTGDNIDHAIWKDSREDNVKDFTYIFQQLYSAFPHAPILPILGNHESLPLNIFAPPNITDDNLSQQWLYTETAKLWSKWLPESSLQTVRKQGYYSFIANNKFKIIALNNNICYIYNWWLLYDTNFLNEQLEFLKNELMRAESQGQFVHILAHVFPGEKECVQPWEASYNSLIARYSHIIKGQFFGHTHTDGFKVFYNKEDGKPISVGYNGASLTTYTKYNPNYKIVTVDPNTYDILDIDTYFFNLTEANLNPKEPVRWQKLYSMKEAYGLDTLSPENFDALAKKISEDSSLFNKYWRFYVREGDASLKEQCDRNCKDELTESLTRTEYLT